MVRLLSSKHDRVEAAQRRIQILVGIDKDFRMICSVDRIGTNSPLKNRTSVTRNSHIPSLPASNCCCAESKVVGDMRIVRRA